MANIDETLAALTTAFDQLTGTGDTDVTADDTGGIDVSADTWTFHAEGWSGPSVAWLAHDDEPDKYDAASIDAIFHPAELTALAKADRELDGALSTALIASDDPLSMGLADVLMSIAPQRS